MHPLHHSSVPVAANSLSALNDLAADPPARLNVQQALSQHEVVLYIARVPGRRDVFLTPLKPRSKTVTAEDVQSCLYYVHYDSAEDQSLHNRPTLVGLELQRSNGAHLLPPLPPVTASEPLQSILSPALSIRRKPVSHVADLGDHDREIILPRTETEALSPLTSPSITLIRRDPYSGEQWNVAKILDPPVSEVSSARIVGQQELEPARGLPLYIEIDNPGYGKFCDPRSNDSLGVTYPVNSSSAYHVRDGASRHSLRGNSTFMRRLWYEGSQFSNKKGSKFLANEYRPVSSVSPTTPDHQSSFSSTIAGYPDTVTHGRLTTKGNRRSHIKGYTFTSPWNGRCEFGTSTFENSLKCRHRLPGCDELAIVSELRFNLPPQTSTHRKSSSLTIASNVAPWRKHDRASSTGIYTSSQTSAGFVMGHGIGSRSGEQRDGIDLTLGQELAGGGATGKHTKLGKLIVQHQGMQMLDLLVSANMALWWRAYDRIN